MIKRKLYDLKDKFTERANTLFTSMKEDEEEYKDYKIDKKEKIKEKIRGLGKTKDDDEVEGELSPLLDDKTKKKYDISTEEEKETKINRPKEEKDYSKRADLLYPTMKDKEEKEERTEENLDKIDVKKEKETNPKNKQEKLQESDLPKAKKEKPDKLNGELTGGAADIKNMKYSDIKNSANNENDKTFFSVLDIVFGSEGKYVNDEDDEGGPTNMGITQNTYDDYCRRHKLPKKDVKNLTKNETIKVYYNDYWVKSGLNKEKDPIKSLILFDTAVLHGVGRTKEYYKKSNGDLRKILEYRRKHYTDKVIEKPSQEKYLNGWNNRVDKLEKILNRYEGLE
ncbi:MAG: hypothetical protein IJY61_03005 [Candidatus Gastranaerophilales bacterium]|nr:hypothetical protein [Candidatus Gastranaerophilales bacterium]